MHVVCSFTTVPGFTGWKIWRRLRAQGAGLVVAGRMTGTRADAVISERRWEAGHRPGHDGAIAFLTDSPINSTVFGSKQGQATHDRSP